MKENNARFITQKQIFEKSLAINKSKKAGDIIHLEDLESKKPAGFGIEAAQYSDIIGKTLKTNLNKWDFINRNNLYE